MYIEVGMFYKTRNGLKVRIYATDGTDSTAIHGAVLNLKEKWTPYQWFSGGECQMGSNWPMDIVSEWVEPHPAESWPVDAKLLVRDYEGDEWVKRYFAKFEKGLVHSWANGGTSWSACAPTTVWRFVKLAEADDGQG